jgi:DUF1009 family protein
MCVANGDEVRKWQIVFAEGEEKKKTPRAHSAPLAHNAISIEHPNNWFADLKPKPFSCIIQAMEKLLIIAGNGSYPESMIKGARAAGVKHISVLAIRGMTSKKLRPLVDEMFWAGLGEGAKYMTWIEAQNFTHGIMVGQIHPLALFSTRFDARASALLKGLPVKNAHTIFGMVAGVLEDAGLNVLPASCYMDECIPGAGVQTNRAPSPEEQKDIDFGHSIASKICGYDIGQTLVVRDGVVLAVEAYEGTNKAISRGGKLGGKGSVVVKVATEAHDMRFDIPVIGVKTITNLKKAGITALAYQAGRLIMLDKPAVIQKANDLDIAITGIDSGLPTAPVRP